MNSVRRLGKYIVPVVFICICCLGVSYAGWNNRNVLQASVYTGEMSYTFKTVSVETEYKPEGKCTKNKKKDPIFKDVSIDSGKKLEVNVGDANGFLDRMKGVTKIVINYSLEGSSNHSVALKSISQVLGDYSFSLDKNSIDCTYNGAPLPDTVATSLLPETIGSFQVTNYFDGEKGRFEFVPSDPPKMKDKVLLFKDLPKELKTALSDTSKKQLDNTILQVNNLGQNNQMDATDKNKKKNPGKLGDLVVNAEYSLSVDLTFDQYNAH
jgi:hypothetical protein